MTEHRQYDREADEKGQGADQQGGGNDEAPDRHRNRICDHRPDRSPRRHHGADVAVEVVGVASATIEGLQMVRMGGTYIDIGNIVAGDITMPANNIIARQLR
mgnify:CR=1 FL=1